MNFTDSLQNALAMSGTLSRYLHGWKYEFYLEQSYPKREQVCFFAYPEVNNWLPRARGLPSA